MKKLLRILLGMVMVASSWFIYETHQLDRMISSIGLSNDAVTSSGGTLSGNMGTTVDVEAYDLFLKDNMVLSGEGLTVIGYKKSLSGYNIYSIKSDLGITFQIDSFNIINNNVFSVGNIIVVEQTGQVILSYLSGARNESLYLNLTSLPFSGDAEDAMQDTIPKSMQNICGFVKYGWKFPETLLTFELNGVAVIPDGEGVNYGNVRVVDADIKNYKKCNAEDLYCLRYYSDIFLWLLNFQEGNPGKLSSYYCGNTSDLVYYKGLNKIFYELTPVNRRRTEEYSQYVID